MACFRVFFAALRASLVGLNHSAAKARAPGTTLALAFSQPEKELFNAHPGALCEVQGDHLP